MPINITNNIDVDGTTPDAVQGRLDATINVLNVATQRLAAIQNGWVPPGPSNTPPIASQLQTIINLANTVAATSNTLLTKVNTPS